MKPEPTFCLAFLQNMWVRNPERIKNAIARDGEGFRRYFMRYALFAGCKTGRMIKKAFDHELIEQIEFEETTREISGNPKEIFPADLKHIEESIARHNPHVIIAFGAIAHKAVEPLAKSRPYIYAHHPASRHPSSFETLVGAANELRRYV